MPLQNSQYDAIMREYSKRQNKNARLLSDRRAAAFKKIPRLSEIEDETAALSRKSVEDLLSGRSSGTRELRAAIRTLSDEKLTLLKKAGLPQDYLSPSYDCPLCKDTGFVNGEKCSCFRRLETELLYNQSSLSGNLKAESFDSFSLSYYSDQEKDPVSGLTQRALAKKALDAALSLCSHLPAGKNTPGDREK